MRLRNLGNVPEKHPCYWGSIFDHPSKVLIQSRLKYISSPFVKLRHSVAMIPKPLNTPIVQDSKGDGLANTGRLQIGRGGL